MLSHKSQLVRCAVARLLVVACALASGGRELLRTRPPSAATARRHALQALAMFLDDKNVDARLLPYFLQDQWRSVGEQWGWHSVGDSISQIN